MESKIDNSKDGFKESTPKVRLSADNFIELAKARWGELYDYSNVQYIGSQKLVSIICREHGAFDVTPRAHLDGQKCPICREREWRALNRIYDNLQRAGCSNLQLPSSFVSIDFETLYSERLSACSVGLVKYVDGVLVDRYYSLIKPPFNALTCRGPELTWIHGFTRAMVENERTMEEVMPEMEHFIDGLPLVAHNACVEKACLADSTRFYGLHPHIDYDHFIDTYPLSRAVEMKLGVEKSGQGAYSLDTVCRRFGVEAMNHHNALDDAEMCGNLLLKIIDALADDNFQPIDRPIEATEKQTKYRKEDMVQRTDIGCVEENYFKGKVVVLTGFAIAVSQEYGHRLHELGAVVRTSMSKSTDALICGANAGPKKIAQAQEQGTTILSEQEFLLLITE